MKMYLILKYTHTIAAIITISGFMLRGYWMLVDSANLRRLAVRVIPHVVDTVLLSAGIGIVWMLRMNPLTQTWLLAKFAGLVVYILLGTIAIKHGSTKRVRAIALVGAIAVFAYIVGVAVSKSPFSWLS